MSDGLVQNKAHSENGEQRTPTNAISLAML